MNNNQCYTWIKEYAPPEVISYMERLEGVQGPERHLVGDVAERRTRQDDVEVRSREGAGVEEIGGAAELRRWLDRRMDEVRQEMDVAMGENLTMTTVMLSGKAAVLVELHLKLTDMDSQRSDLLNAGSDAPGASGTK